MFKVKQAILLHNATITAQEVKFSIKDLFSEWAQICSFRQIWSHLLKKSLMENFIFCAVVVYSMEKDSQNSGKHLR